MFSFPFNIDKLWQYQPFTKKQPTPFTNNDIIDICGNLSQEGNLQASKHNPINGAIIASISAFIGGLIAGPLGLGIGGSMAAIATAMDTKEKPESINKIINHMNNEQKDKLANNISTVLKNYKIEQDLMATVSSNEELKKVFVAELCSFLEKEFHLNIIINKT